MLCEDYKTDKVQGQKWKAEEKGECVCLCVRAQSYFNSVRTSLANSTLSRGDPSALAQQHLQAGAGGAPGAAPHQSARCGVSGRSSPGLPWAEPAEGCGLCSAPGPNPGPAPRRPLRPRQPAAAPGGTERPPHPDRAARRIAESGEGASPLLPSFPRSGGRPGSRRAGRPAPRGSTWKPGTHQVQSLAPSSASSRGRAAAAAPGDGSAAAASAAAAAAAGGGAPAAAAASSMARRCPGPAPAGCEQGAMEGGRCEGGTRRKEGMSSSTRTVAHCSQGSRRARL